MNDVFFLGWAIAMLGLLGTGMALVMAHDDINVLKARNARLRLQIQALEAENMEWAMLDAERLRRAKVAG